MMPPHAGGLSRARFLYRVTFRMGMAKKNDNTFASSAGLMRYFDTEDDRGIRVGPKVVVGVGIAFTIFILVLPVFFPV